MAKNQFHITGEVFMDAYLGWLLYSTIKTFGMTDFNVRKRQKVGEVANRPQKIVRNKNKRSSNPSGSKVSKAGSSFNDIHYQTSSDGLKKWPNIRPSLRKSKNPEERMERKRSATRQVHSLQTGYCRNAQKIRAHVGQTAGTYKHSI